MISLSFLPASTHMIYDLGLEDKLGGVTFECPSDKPKIVRSFLEGNTYSSSEIDAIVSEYARENKTLYYIDMELLSSIQPDIIFTQHVCDVCQIGTSFVEKAIYGLPKQPKLVPLVPRRLNDVFDNALLIAKELGEEQKGISFVKSSYSTIDSIVDTLRANRAPLRRVSLLEWMDPIYNCGHWIPEQISYAGGSDAMSAPAGYSTPVPWNRIQYYDPEVLIFAPCGFHVDRSLTEAHLVEKLEGLKDLISFKNKKIYFVDADLFTRPSVSSMTDGIKLLSYLFHPDLFPMPVNLTGKFKNLDELL